VPTSQPAPPTTVIWLRRLFVGLAGLNFAALLLFLAVYAMNRPAIDRWVSTAPMFASLVRQHGLTWAVNYAVITTTAVHIVITGLFLWLAAVIGHGRRATRIRATALLVISIFINLFATTSPVGGITQQILMGISVAAKIIALVLLWLPATRAFDINSRLPGASTKTVDVQFHRDQPHR
jgi:hypothetical protein